MTIPVVLSVMATKLKPSTDENVILSITTRKKWWWQAMGGFLCDHGSWCWWWLATTTRGEERWCLCLRRRKSERQGIGKWERERERERERGEEQRQWGSMLGRGLGWRRVEEEKLAMGRNEEWGEGSNVQKWEMRRKRKENIIIFLPVWMQHKIYIYIYIYTFELQYIFSYAL